MCVFQLADWVKESKGKSGDHKFHRPIDSRLRELISDAPGQIELSAAAAEESAMSNPADVGVSMCDDVMVVVIPPIECWALIFRYAFLTLHCLSLPMLHAPSLQHTSCERSYSC